MNTTKSIVALAAAFTACAAGGQTWPQFENPMVHVLIAFDGTDLTAHAEGANLDMINYAVQSARGLARAIARRQRSAATCGRFMS